MIRTGPATPEEAIFDLDFRAVMHWGQDPVLEKHYSQNGGGHHRDGRLRPAGRLRRDRSRRAR